MPRSLNTDTETLEAALRSLLQTMKRPSTWSYITRQSGVDLDRPAAAILQVLIASEPKACHLNELAQLLGIEAPSVTRKVQQLEQAGLLKREQEPDDRRAYVLQVTKAGHATAQSLHAVQRQVMSETLKSWPAEDTQRFSELFTRFSQGLADQYQGYNK